MGSRLRFLLLIGLLALQAAAVAAAGSREAADSAFATGIAHYEAKRYARALDAWRSVLREVLSLSSCLLRA